MALNTALMFSKASDEWATPEDFYQGLHMEFNFQWDAAASKANAKCGIFSYYGPDHTEPHYQDALAITPRRVHGRDRFWLNPPYSKCREFIGKASAEAGRGALVVCLIPSRTDTRWWHEYIWDNVRHCARPSVEIRFHKGRLKFGDSGNSAPFPSVVVIFRPRS